MYFSSSRIEDLFERLQGKNLEDIQIALTGQVPEVTTQEALAAGRGAPRVKPLGVRLGGSPISVALLVVTLMTIIFRTRFPGLAMAGSAASFFSAFIFLRTHRSGKFLPGLIMVLALVSALTNPVLGDLFANGS